MKTTRREQTQRLACCGNARRLRPWATAKLFMLLAMLMLSVQGAWAQYYNVYLEGIQYRLENTTATVMSFDNSIEDLFIPAKVQHQGKDYIVSSIWGSVKFTNQKFKSVTFEEGCAIKSLPIFGGCLDLESITLPSGLTSVADNQFIDCHKLTSIIIPGKVVSIGSFAFRNCPSLKSIEIPNSVTSIGTEAFRNCTSLKSIEIPNSVTSIDRYAFYNCIYEA